ncbi:hypothetical protein [Amycolatopsis sp. NPDC004169]|uniref:hypothetical protein n=1 Tax=Amycolatopsis sp. NPDC004169 TaxID=3154453 RepID=UPI0033B02FD4
MKQARSPVERSTTKLIKKTGDLVPSLAATGRADLIDAQWAILESPLPVGKKPRRPPLWSKRQLLEGIRWRAAGLITWEVSVDSTINRARQHAAGACIESDLQKGPPGGIGEPGPANHTR